MHTQATKGIRRILGRILAGALIALVGMIAHAERLAPEKLIVSDVQSGKRVSEATDNDLATAWTDGGKGLLVDLGRETLVHRIYLHPGAGVKEQVLQVKVSFLAQADEAAPALLSFALPQCDWWKVRGARQGILKAGSGDILPTVATHMGGDPKIDVSLKFNPTRARYLRIEGPARIAALEIFGSADPAAFEKGDAVVLPLEAPDLLRLAAEELRYYVGELTGRPLPIIAPAEQAAYPGNLYVIEDLRSLAPTREAMLANVASGKLPPDGVNVLHEGRTVVFRAWPYRNVLLSSWEFLRRQGVVWAYPDDMGDFVPAGKGVDLAMLPLRYRPSAERRFANCFKICTLYPYTDAFLYFARNGYSSGSGLDSFWGQHGEVPADPAKALRGREQVKPEHAEGFDGYPHNFSGVIPNRLLEANPEWCGMNPGGERLPPHKGGPPTFCMTSPGAIAFVAGKILDWVGTNRNSDARFNLLPMDGTRYCQCPRCLEICRPPEPTDVPWVPGMPFMVSEAYYHFVAEVARRVAPQAPHVRIFALAYADVLSPPRKMEKLPDNVIVEVCVYGSRNLPMASPANAAMRTILETWAAKCATLENYQYQLIEGEWMELPMPLPSVAAIADRARFLHRLNALNGGTQSWTHCLPHNPWNHYAFARTMWDAGLDADRILSEFFPAYYREAAGPMLAYYRAFADHIIGKEVDLQVFGYDQGPTPDAFPPEVVAVMRKHLAEARDAAKTWFVKQRVGQAAADLEWAVPASLRRSIDVETALRHGKRKHLVPRRKGEVVIDGNPDEEAWQAAPVSGGFILPRTHQNVATERQTEFRMLWDDERLVVTVRCAHPEIASYAETDAHWGARTDAVEVFLVADQTYTAAYYQMAVSAFGRTMEPKRYFHDQWHRDMEWIGGPIKAAARVADGYWTAEIAIPFALLKEGAPKAGDVWRVNLARSGAGTWSPLQFGAHHLYRDFNFITFTE